MPKKKTKTSKNVSKVVKQTRKTRQNAVNVGKRVGEDQTSCHQCGEKGEDGVICQKCGSNQYSVTKCSDHNTKELYRGNAVGVATKQVLEAVEYHFPNTFEWDQIDSQAFWLGILEDMCLAIKAFLEILADELPQDQIGKFQQRLTALKGIGFDLSWVDNRMDMVKKLKLEHGQLNLDLKVMGDFVQLLEETMVEREKEHIEAVEMLEKAQSGYDKAKKALDDKESELKRSLSLFPGTEI